LYKIASNLRVLWYSLDSNIVELIGDSLKITEYSFNELSDSIGALSYRLSFIEPTIFPIYFDELGLNDISNLVNIETSILSSINRMIPGKLFGEILYTEFAYGFMYDSNGISGVFSESGRVDYAGYEWTIFGISYQLFGFYLGLIFITFSIFGISSLVKYAIRLKSYYSNVYALFFVIALELWVRNLGLDNFLDRIFHTFIFLSINILIFKLFKNNLKRLS
jgi:hypothetical protein